MIWGCSRRESAMAWRNCWRGWTLLISFPLHRWKLIDLQSILHYNCLLFQTVTSRLLVADTPAEAVENIILHTDKVLVLNKENIFDILNLNVLLLPRIHRYPYYLQILGKLENSNCLLWIPGNRLTQAEKDQERAALQISTLKEGSYWKCCWQGARYRWSSQRSRAGALVF